MSDAFDRLVHVMDRLRDPGGCPWDREQTLESLCGYLLEECHEAVEAVAAEDPRELCEELGDLLLQIVFMARIARENGWFDMDEVCHAISDKMVHRHPHVFGDRQVEDAAEVIRNWEEIKRGEREKEERSSALDGVPQSLPGLLKAYRMTQKAAALGFDWRRPVEVVGKLHEEVAELEAELAAGDADGDARVREEMGDILFVMANLARHLNVEPETALQGSNRKFLSRFQAMERLCRKRGVLLSELDLEAMDSLWNEAKDAERRG